jgi:hypothetical protein
MRSIELTEYIKTEYSTADREYVIGSINRRNRVNRLKLSKDLLIEKETTTVIKPSSEAYSYFLEEYKDKLEKEHDNIIVPNNKLVRK